MSLLIVLNVSIIFFHEKLFEVATQLNEFIYSVSTQKKNEQNKEEKVHTEGEHHQIG